LELKQRYNRSSPVGKRLLVGWYVWEHILHKNPLRVPALVRRMIGHRFNRGMNLFADIRDWLGGWPMEYTTDQDVVDLLEQEHDFRLINATTGEACSEFLFVRSGRPAERTIVSQLVARKAVERSIARLPAGASLERVTLNGPFFHQNENLYIVMLPQLAAAGDTQTNSTRSPVLLEEDGTIIGQPHCAHADIATYGGGRFSHWGGAFYFSTSDNSDPNTNDRTYTLVYPSAESIVRPPVARV
jgi:hypothetical protein